MFTSNLKFFYPILKVAVALEREKIPFSLCNCYHGAQLRFPWCDGDIACHDGTYSSSVGRVESYQFPWDAGDVSVLTPKEAIENIVNYYKTLDN